MMLTIFIISAGVWLTYYHPMFMLLSIMGAFLLFLGVKRRREFIESYTAYRCANEEDFAVPDKFIKMLYYGKNYLYDLNLLNCKIIPYEGLQIDKASSMHLHLSNRDNHRIKARLDISQASIPNIKEYFLNNIEQAKSMDINNPAVKREIADLESKQNALSMAPIFKLLGFNVAIVLLPVIVVLDFNESMVVLTLLITLSIATVVTAIVSARYFKKMFRYKNEVEESGGEIYRFYRTYLRAMLLPIVAILFFWFIAVVMAADIWFNTWLF